ncbi:hypothetical protein [Pseudomonas sp. FFUP_PS_473]|uniref:gp53-like domain-containing protein n=1 Tax=Pseudomonas sp. FFUP_PS_473 TaxID=2060418 RepID=UPI0035322166
MQAAIDALVGSAPEALNAINELAAALGNDPNFATTMLNLMAGKVAASDKAVQFDAETGTNDTKWMTPLRVFQAIGKVVKQATESAFGWAKVGTQDQVDTGTDDTTFVTPKKLRFGFQASLAQNGYIVFPSWMLGLIIQWGRYASGAHSPTVSFPIAFTTQVFVVIGGANDDNDSVSVNSYGLTWFVATQLDGGAGTNVSSPFFWLAFGK